MQDLIKKQKYRMRLIYNFLTQNNMKWLTIRIILTSAYYRFLVKYLSSTKLEEQMGKRDQESSFDENLELLRYAYIIGKRVDRVCDKTYWESKCLIKALTAQKFLIEKHIKSTLYLGVGKENDKMVAHAWLRCGALYVTGGDGQNYSVVAKFVK